MTKPKPKLNEDVEGLLKKSVVEEAMEAVWLKLEKSLQEVEPENGELLGAFFNGHSPQRIAADLGSTEEEVKALLDRAKRDLRNQLRSQTKMKQ